MSEYIERGALLTSQRWDGLSLQHDKARAKEIILCQPAADVAEVKHGRWVQLDAHRGIEDFKCSVCRSECYVPTCMNEPMYGYCPNCGAIMDGGKDNG